MLTDSRFDEAEADVDRGTPWRFREPDAPNPITLEVTDADAAERIVAEAEGRFGSIDVIVNGAGQATHRDLEDVPDEAWYEAWELNVMAPMRLGLRVTRCRARHRVFNMAMARSPRPRRQVWSRL